MSNPQPQPLQLALPLPVGFLLHPRLRQAQLQKFEFLLHSALSSYLSHRSALDRSSTVKSHRY